MGDNLQDAQGDGLTAVGLYCGRSVARSAVDKCLPRFHSAIGKARNCARIDELLLTLQTERVDEFNRRCVSSEGGGV